MFLPKKGCLKPQEARIGRPSKDWSLDSEPSMKMMSNSALPRPRRPRAAFTLQEVVIAMGIVLLLIGFSAPFIITSRGKTGVNTAVEITKALLDRAGEEARTVGYPLADALKQDGLSDLAIDKPGSGGRVTIRLRKRLSSGTEPLLLTQKALAVEEVAFSSLGRLDLESESEINGLFVEFVVLEGGGSESLLATVPVDVNGEFVLAGNAGDGHITFSYGDYSRSINLTINGTSRLDRR